MCAILDSCVRGEVFGPKQTPAGRYFFEWLNNRAGGRTGRLVIGGRLERELTDDAAQRTTSRKRLDLKDNLKKSRKAFMDWLVEAQKAGRIHKFSSSEVKAAESNISGCASNDSHVLALAKLSGARLLYSNDQKLQDDFANVLSPRGRVYTTKEHQDIRPTHRKLLNRTDLCRRCQRT